LPFAELILTPRALKFLCRNPENRLSKNLNPINMKTIKTLLLFVFPLVSSTLLAQQRERAEKLVEEGVAYHDRGDYEGAISKYNRALELDKDNLLALTEKAYSLLTQQKYEESIKCCKKAVEVHPGDAGLKTLYVTYGSAYDALKKTGKSVEVYDEGIKLFPDFYLLYFNKGITLSADKRYDEAIPCLQKSLTLNPKHAGSHNALARILDIKNKRIPSLLAFCRFLSLEPEGTRAKAGLALMQEITKGNVEKTGKNSITINISPDMLGDTLPNGKPKENSFTATDLILAMDAGLDYDKKNKKKTEVELFIGKFGIVCSSLKETRKDNYGFYWDYYVPYFVEMNDKKLVEPFAYLAFSSSGDADVLKWLKAHKSEVEKFYDWSKSFTWKAG
jgi:tetratricopeptide (TPR) repeat protein